MTEEKVSCLLEQLLKYEQQELLIMYRYPNSPNEIPLDNSDLIAIYRKYDRDNKNGALKKLLSVYPKFKTKLKMGEKG